MESFVGEAVLLLSCFVGTGVEIFVGAAVVGAGVFGTGVVGVGVGAGRVQRQFLVLTFRKLQLCDDCSRATSADAISTWQPPKHRSAGQQKRTSVAKEIGGRNRFAT